MAALTNLDRTWQLVETLSVKQQEKLNARLNALLSLQKIEGGKLHVRPNSLTMGDVRREQKAARAARRRA